MTEPAKVLTEAAPIKDVTPAVEQLKQDAGVTAEQHTALQKEADASEASIMVNKEAIDKLKASDVNTQTSRDEEAQRNREAIAALQLKQDILDGKYSKTQPVPATTTVEQDKTVQLQRQEEARMGLARFIIAIMVVATSSVIYGYQVFFNSNAAFPTSLATALGAVILYFFQKPSAILGSIPAYIDTQPKNSNDQKIS